MKGGKRMMIIVMKKMKKMKNIIIFIEIKYKKILAILENNAACIEYLDNEETDTCLIAMNKDEITPYHTHLEIHPSTILSVVSGNIPMCNHIPISAQCFPRGSIKTSNKYVCN